MSSMNHEPAVPRSVIQYFLSIPRILNDPPFPDPFETAIVVPVTLSTAFLASSRLPFTCNENLGDSLILLLRYITVDAGMAPNPSITLQAISREKNLTDTRPTRVPSRSPKPCMAKTIRTILPLFLTFAYSLMMVELTG